jgi:hypothetical protein
MAALAWEKMRQMMEGSIKKVMAKKKGINNHG